MVDALTTCKELFVRFGGHAAAAGFTISNENIEALDTHLQRLAATALSEEMLTPTLTIDGQVELAQVGWPLFNELQQLEPFGQANQQPILMSSNVEVQDARTRGADGQHLRLLLRRNGGPTIEAIAFRMGHLTEALRRHPRIDIAYTLDAREWNNERNLQVNVKDLRRAEAGIRD
jgi:single-stranded-DNA-specific exonuclease